MHCGSWIHRSFLLSFVLLICRTNAELLYTPADGNTTHHMTLTSKFQKDLLANYSRNSRPVKNESTSVVVYIALHLNHVDDVNEVQQVLQIHGSMTLAWTDEYLTWAVADRGYMRKLHLPLWYIWKPDINIYNSASGKDDTHISYVYPAWVTYSGAVTTFPPVSFRVACIFDFTYYPYDKQNCSVILGSWRYDSEEMEMYHAADYISLSSAWDNRERSHMSGWKIIGSGTSKTYRNWKGTTMEPLRNARNWPQMRFWVQIQRHEPYFAVTFLLPGVCCALLTCMAVWLNNERLQVILLLGNFILQAIFLRGLVLKLPPSTGSLPKIVRYYEFSLCLNFIAIIICAILASIAAIEAEVPQFLRNVPVIYQRIWSRSWTTQHKRLESDQEDLPNQAVPAPQPLAGQLDATWTIILPIIRLLLTVIFLLTYFLAVCVLLT